jgi:hypothetical protein
MPICPQCQRVLPEDFKVCPYDAAYLGPLEATREAAPIARTPAEHVMIAGLFDRFEVKRRLGQGGMSTVFHAVERSAGMDVAIKVMSNVHARSPPERTASSVLSPFLRGFRTKIRLTTALCSPRESLWRATEPTTLRLSPR